MLPGKVLCMLGFFSKVLLGTLMIQSEACAPPGMGDSGHLKSSLITFLHKLFIPSLFGVAQG